MKLSSVTRFAIITYQEHTQAKRNILRNIPFNILLLKRKGLSEKEAFIC